MKLKINFCLLVLVCSFSYGQMSDYTFKRELQGITDKWHSLALPTDIFKNINSNFSDIRIYGITENKDTLEAPYLLRISKEKRIKTNIQFKMINSSHNKNGYYITFRIPVNQDINQIRLDFVQDNFDWKVNLEGSQHQQEWFQIVANYRIVAIKNKQTKYRFTKLVFPNANYQYYRLLIKSKTKPIIKTAHISFDNIVASDVVNYAAKKISITEEKTHKQTVVDVNLKDAVPVSSLTIKSDTTFDYYRPITIKYLTDSVKTEKGWHYNFRTLTSGTLSSLENNTFTFESTTLQKLKIIIHNYDNEPVTIKHVKVQGYTHKLIARFTKPATYYLVYGNSFARTPQYDLSYLTKKVPDTLANITLKPAQLIDKKDIKTVEPLFTNKAWLWGIMGLIIIVLGGFTLKMMKKK